MSETTTLEIAATGSATAAKSSQPIIITGSLFFLFGFITWLILF